MKLFGNIVSDVLGGKGGLQLKFKDRVGAGVVLANVLRFTIKRRKDEKVLVLGVLRGGVIVADIAAKKLNADFDIVIPRKLSAPDNKENAITTFVDISCMNPDSIGAGTGVVFFSTNCNGQLAFLDNMVGISQSEFYQEGGTIRTWEWKGGTLPFETDSSSAMGNQTIITSVLEEED
jgi:hypothetical protein